MKQGLLPLVKVMTPIVVSLYHLKEFKENLSGAHEDTVFARISLLADTVFARVILLVSPRR